MPSSAFLVEPTRAEAGDQGIAFGRRENCDRRARLTGREQQQARRRDQLVLKSRAHGIVLKCGHVCPSMNGRKFSRRLHGWQNTEDSAAASCKNVRSTEMEYHSHV